MITLGAVGVISVIGNAFPREFSRMTRLALQGDFANALTINHRFTELFSLLFVDGKMCIRDSYISTVLNSGESLVEKDMFLYCNQYEMCIRDRMSSVLTVFVLTV